MAKIKKRGNAGAAKAYMTRSAAIKKLQCSLADFRRLCILKGIFPREPRSRKKANKGSSAPTAFYYAKDIGYLAHEPVLKKLREQKAFAKRLNRALGRNEWSSAKSLEDNKPVYRLDHIIKERYPTFIDALRDIDDALCLVSLFASLPSNPRLPPSLIENCARLSAEWQLYIMHSRSLRKAFLSIKGVYFQAEVMDQNITWLVPYQFAQSIPPDVDIRVMLTFLELYQTLLGFVFFKLYTDAGLVYPPPLDAKKDEGAAGVGAYSLQELLSNSIPAPAPAIAEGGDKPEISKKNAKQVRQAIKSIVADASNAAIPDEDKDRMEVISDDPQPDTTVSDEFHIQPSKKDSTSSAAPLDSASILPDLHTISSLPRPQTTTLFSAHTFWISRETPRPLMEFLIRSFGGRVGWPASSGGGSPFGEEEGRITHVVVDRPLPPQAQSQAQAQAGSEGASAVTTVSVSEEERERRSRRKYVQPQWVVDCINAGRILLEEPYEQGKALPPHLSPFGEERGAYEPGAEVDVEGEGEGVEVGSEEEEEEIEGEEDEDMDGEVESKEKKLKKKKVVVEVEVNGEGDGEIDEDDPAAQRAAELQAEAAGIDFGTFEKEMSKKRKKKRGKKGAASASTTTAGGLATDGKETSTAALKNGGAKEGEVDGDGEAGEKEMNKMMMSSKKRKLYEKMKFGERRREAERLSITKKKEMINKANRRMAGSGVKMPKSPMPGRLRGM